MNAFKQASIAAQAIEYLDSRNIVWSQPVGEGWENAEAVAIAWFRGLITEVELNRLLPQTEEEWFEAHPAARRYEWRDYDGD